MTGPDNQEPGSVTGPDEGQQAPPPPVWAPGAPPPTWGTGYGADGPYGSYGPYGPYGPMQPPLQRYGPAPAMAPPAEGLLQLPDQPSSPDAWPSSSPV